METENARKLLMFHVDHSSQLLPMQQNRTRVGAMLSLCFY